MDITRSGIEAYSQAILELQGHVIESQREPMASVAKRMADVVDRGERLFVFGSGHSHMIAEEAFFRAGGLAAVVPVFASSLMLHENPGLGSRLERSEGLAAPLLDRYQPQVGEMIFIFSNSGVNRLPVELALYARDIGLFVVSISSLAYSRVAPLSSLGKRLDEVSDIALDNGGIPGDALVALPGTAWRVGASSTITGALIWNCLVCECVFELQRRGADLPLIASYNLSGAFEHNQALLSRWRAGNPHLG